MSNNLDLMAQKSCQRIAAEAGRDKIENVVTKTIGVLQENGVYASMLFLWTRPKDEQKAARAIRTELIRIAQELLVTGKKDPVEGTPEHTMSFVTGTICSDLESLILVKQVWEQTLIYARYTAKMEPGN